MSQRMARDGMTTDEKLRTILRYGVVEVGDSDLGEEVRMRFYSRDEIIVQESSEQFGRTRYLNDVTVFADNLNDAITLIFAVIVAIYLPE